MSSESFTLTPGLVGSVSGVGSGKTGSVTPEASSEKRTPFFSGAGGGIAKPSDFLGAGGGMRSASVPLAEAAMLEAPRLGGGFSEKRVDVDFGAASKAGPAPDGTGAPGLE
eukprot:CAMPEP_0174304286 /NCGR_PEP_ID=MMETSP0809-20121228/60690_1 /TAXON_ID=73025 ORGANISM="Eutreptiella gymnastica-like, Strain CCMP1594" /NCGR_SAMPLE_ID=MMETSP0809 /ASSEMBLY_ACC=CAM_ASM_000658 /LENGTH=110 /DNA_ID=CAMNT_0015410475 /DNA_START=1942 /DNA_END=2271 /DNA_ORIENTATION=-